MTLPQICFLLLCASVILINTTRYYKKYKKTQKLRKTFPYTFPGFKFSGLADLLKNSQYVGYLTDKDPDDPQQAMQFAQAQFVLAPVILDRNIVQHEYILFDYSDTAAAWQLIKKQGLQPVRRNQLGIILVKNPQALKVFD